MGFFGFVKNIASSAIKVVATPVTAVKDIIDGEPLTSTSDLISSALDDVNDATDEILD